MKEYTFKHFWKDLNDGIEIYYTYLGKRYLMSKVSKNCYKQILVSDNKKNPGTKMSILTLKRVSEIFDEMSEFEYKTGI